MKKMKRLTAGAMALLMAAAMAAVPTAAKATTAAETTAADTTAAAEDSGEEKVFRFASSTEPTTLDPTKGNSVPDNEIQHAITEGLVRTIDGEPTAACAESWDVSDDQKTYTFHLRDGLKWSDGVDMKASDFVYGIQRLVDPNTGSLYAWVAATAGIVNAEACNAGEKDLSELGVSAPDDSTVVIELENPTPYFLSLLGSCCDFNPVRQDIVEEYGNDFAATAEKNVYSGPFIMTSSENQVYVYEPNPYYWNKDAVHFTRVEQNIVTDANTQFAMYQAGDLDYVSIPLEQVQEYKDDPLTHSYKNGNDDYIYINCQSETQPLLQDADFRRALNYAIDRENYITLATNDVYEPACTFVLPDVAGATEGETYGDEYGDTLHAWPLNGDVDKAKECLQKAMDNAGITDPSSIVLNFTCTDNESEKKIVEVVQQMWVENLGIDVEIQQITYAEKYSTVFPQHDYEVGYGGWSPDYSDPYTYLELFRGDNSNNYSAYQNDEYDEKLATTVTETDPTTRMATLAECENILLDDAAMVPLQYRTQYYMLDETKFTGLKFAVGAFNFDWAYGDIAS